MSDVHPDNEALSAYLDGEDLQWRDHIAGCSSCTLHLDQLRRVGTAIATSVPPPHPGQRDAAIARALRAMPGENARPWHRGHATRAAGIAAALLLVVGAAFAITQLSDSNPNDQPMTAAGGTADDAGALEGAPAAGAVGDLGDLGELAGSAALRAIVEPKVAEFAQDGAAQAAPPAPATDADSGAPRYSRDGLASGVACDGVARSLDPKNVDPTHAGIATWQGTPASVFVYSVQGQPGALHLYVLARADCRVLEFQSYTP
jgi:hypothetical protein